MVAQSCAAYVPGLFEEMASATADEAQHSSSPSSTRRQRTLSIDTRPNALASVPRDIAGLLAPLAVLHATLAHERRDLGARESLRLILPGDRSPPA